MDKEKSFFVYTPPKSNSHGHAVRDKNISRGLKKVVDAVVENFGAEQSDKMELNIYYDKVNVEEFLFAKNTIVKLNQLLGKPLREWENTGYEYLKNSMTWESAEKNIFDVLSYLETKKNEELLPLNQFWICQFYSYGNNEIANGDIMCSIESGKLFVRLHLIFPFSIDDERTYKLIEKLNKELPLKLSSKNFRRLGPNKNKYGQWKLDDKTLKRIESCLK